MGIAFDPGSYRDPSGSIFCHQDRIYRTINECAAPEFEFARDSGILPKMVEDGICVGYKEVNRSHFSELPSNVCYVLEHPKLPFISYPYEWSFSSLKRAALFQLNLLLSLLDRGGTLSDSSAYNIQFTGSTPVFIDHLSICRYNEGQFWTGHRQFCEQFLHPLLLRAKVGVNHNNLFRGSLEGITGIELKAFLPIKSKISWKMFVHVIFPAMCQSWASKKAAFPIQRVKDRKLPQSAFRGMLEQLYQWVKKLEPRNTSHTPWADYRSSAPYQSDEEQKKAKFVAEFSGKVVPEILWDIGCNTGTYSAVALKEGAKLAIGFETDSLALEKASMEAEQRGLNFLPLYIDVVNPSPDQGWNQSERSGLQARCGRGGLLALAVLHHMCLGRNVPLEKAVNWLIDLAPTGVIEYVHKADPTAQRMLQLRKDIFVDYTLDNFISFVSSRAKILKMEAITSNQRTLIWYQCV